MFIMKNDFIKEITLKHLFRKENIIFSIIITVLLIIILILVTTINFTVNYKNMNDNLNITARTLIVNKGNKSEEELNSLSNIEHVAINVSDKFRNPLYEELPEYDEEYSKGYIQARALLSKDSLKIVDGRTIQNDNEMLIPNKFYPHSEYDNNMDEYVNLNKILDGKDLIGKQITLSSQKGHPIKVGKMTEKEYQELWNEWDKSKERITFTIVGTFDPSVSMIEKNMTYISMNSFDRLKNDISGSTSGEDIYGNYHHEIFYYDGRMIVADKYKNLEYIKQELDKKGFSYETILEYDYATLLLITSVPIAIGIVILIITICLIRNFITKKFKNRYNEIGLLKTLGYRNKHIKDIESYENIAIFIFSIVISVVLYFIILLVLKYNLPFLMLMEFYSTKLSIPYLYFILFFILIICYIKITSNRICSKYLKYSASQLLKED